MQTVSPAHLSAVCSTLLRVTASSNEGFQRKHSASPTLCAVGFVASKIYFFCNLGDSVRRWQGREKTAELSSACLLRSVSVDRCFGLLLSRKRRGGAGGGNLG